MSLPRVQLFELEDLAWFPRVIRDYATDYLQFIEHRLRLHRPVMPLLRDLLERSGSERIVDLCSGGSGPLRAVIRELRESGLEVQVLLTDKYPNLEAFKRAQALSGGSIGFLAESVDARDVPPDLPGIRTLFNSFHHFTPDDARAIIRGAVGARQPIAVFEIPERKLSVVLSTLLAPFMVLLATPFIRPFRWGRLVYTYLLPLIPLTCLWDGVVSQLRAYTPDELDRLAEDVSTEYAWASGKVAVGGLPARLTYLIGHPQTRLPSGVE